MKRSGVLAVRHFSSAASNEHLGFIGLGNMGFHMCYNLAKKSTGNLSQLTVFDVDANRVRAFHEKCSQTIPSVKVYSATSPAEVGKNCPVVITMLPSSPHVKQVYTSSDGLLSSISPGSLLIDSSTIDPMSSREVAKAALAKNASMIDAPVSGGVGGAENATLTFMVGGDENSFNRALPILNSMGKSVFHCGDIGTGQAAKIANNLILAVSMIGVSEGMNLGVKMGVDPKVLAGIINVSSGRCWSSDTYNPCPGVMDNVPSARNYQGGFGSSLMKKDLGLAATAAMDARISIPMASLAHQIYTLIESSGAENKDFSYVFRFLQNAGQDKSN